MPQEEKDRVEIRFVPLPPEKRTGYEAALRWLIKLMREDLEERAERDYPVCEECGVYLHLTTEGKLVCRNEICPNYS